MKKDLPEIITEVLSQRAPTLIEDTGGLYRHAAVLVPLFNDGGEYKLLFTKRTRRVEAHKGQISFPGGGVEESDGSYEQTALREAHEEVGLLPGDVKILGRTDDALTLTSNYMIHPFVGLIPYPYAFTLNSHEVKALLRVPVRVFLEEGAGGGVIPVEYEGRTYEGYAYRYDGEVIWGATARIMFNLVEILGKTQITP
ncbi:MAG: CoA pyrophosphatase [Desulfobacterales bacterium]|nr:CoA pyrophosphatase [Desulfobacterales bacterium]